MRNPSQLGFLAAGILAIFSPAAAQITIHGSFECERPAAREEVEVGDRSPHTMALSQRFCRPAEPLEVAGIPAAGAALTLLTDARPDLVRDRGYFVLAFTNGDRLLLHWTADSTRGRIVLGGATGRLLGITGSGTLTIRTKPNGTIEVQVEAKYTLPKP